MKIALDIDDTISEAPEFFSAFTKAMRTSGHEIHVVTARHFASEPATIKELETWGIEYDYLEFSVQKEQYCRDNGIEYAFDDYDLYYANSQVCKFALFKVFYPKEEVEYWSRELNLIKPKTKTDK